MKPEQRAEMVALAHAVREVSQYSASGGQGDLYAEGHVAGYNEAIETAVDVLLGLLRDSMRSKK